MNRMQGARSANNGRVFQPKLLALAMTTVMSQSVTASPYGIDSQRRATALNAQGNPLGERNVAFGGAGEAYTVEDVQGARVAVSNDSAALIWTEESSNSDSPKRLRAIFLPSIRDANSDKPSGGDNGSASSGGSAGWLTLCLAGCLLLLRRFPRLCFSRLVGLINRQ